VIAFGLNRTGHFVRFVADYGVALGFEPCTLCWVQRIFMYP
jgi:disulfide bond formation protein DsbB